MVTEDTQQKPLTRFQITIDQTLFIQTLWKEIQQANQIRDNRIRENIRWKHAFMCVVSEQTVLSLKEIGRVLNKDHATVIHARKMHESNMLCDERYRNIYNMISAEVEETLDQYQDQIFEVIRDKHIPINGAATEESIVLMYEERIQSLKKRHKKEILQLKSENSILTKEYQRALLRAQGLNEECKRLKNLL